MVVINPREIAAEALMEIIEQDAYNNMALRKILRQNGAMSPQDRRLVTEIVNGTLRNLIYIDWILNQFSTVKTEKMKPWICSVLRTATYQILFLDKVPHSAVCNEAVKLTKKKGFEKLSGFVNGVLRKLLREWKSLPLPEEKKDPAEYLEILYSHPRWLLKMWLHEYPYEFVKNLCRKNNESPDVTAVCNRLKITPEELEVWLQKEGVTVKKGIYHSDLLHLSGTANLAGLESFQKGFFHIQDESSALAVQALDPQPGEKILDICAAPGGKSMLAAERMKNKGLVLSRDIFEHKLELIEETAQRLGIRILKTEKRDASEPIQEEELLFDRVLVDAPCSGFGLIRKKPDLKWRRSGEDIDALIQLQRKILAASATYVKKDGILVYSTCTICKKENQKNVEWFLSQYPFELCDLKEFLPKELWKEEKGENYLQLFPHIHNTDGFFIARMKRKG